MKALRFSKFGPPSVLTIEDISKPQPREGESLVGFLDFYYNRSHLIGVDSAHFTAAEIGEIGSALLPGFESNALN